jgi:hypothetical protein
MIDDGIEKKKLKRNWARRLIVAHVPEMRGQLSHSNFEKAIQRFGF